MLMQYHAWAQQDLFTELSSRDVKLTQSESVNYNIFKQSPFVKEILFIKINTDLLNQSEFDMTFKGATTHANRRRVEFHSDKSDFSWFGTLTDQSGVFFTVMNNQVASKFYIGSMPCLIVPFRGDVHMLIIYDNAIDNGVCGTFQSNDSKMSSKPPGKSPDVETLANDEECTLRIMLVVTNQAIPEIPMSLDIAARMLQDESNLAYQQSQINYRMEVARVVTTNYAETTGFTTATAYGTTSSFPTDLVNLRTGGGLLGNIPGLRNLYNADVVVMVRSQATNTAQGFYGIAFGIATGTQAIDPNNGFAIISTEFMIGGRFTFAHEIGHIQGARHDTHTAVPAYARGFIFSGAGITNRTIMAVGGSCNPPTGCRIQFFSNPNLNFGGVPIGVANQRDNARRINETATQILANRITSTNLLLPAETFNSGILANHLAMQTLSTNNNAVIALSGSHVTMRAGTNVSLLPGFHAMAGSNFSAYISTCSVIPSNTFARSSSDQSNIEGTEEIEDALTVKVYPNPTTGLIEITYPPESKNLIITDVMGKVVIYKSIIGTRSTEVNLSVHTQGLYILRVDGRRPIRLIKE